MAKATIWQSRVRAWRASGETAGEFAEGKGFSEATLRWWAWKLSREGPAGSESPRLARVVRTRARAGADERRSAGGVTIEVGGARICVGAGAERATLREVLAALRESESER